MPLFQYRLRPSVPLLLRFYDIPENEVRGNALSFEHGKPGLLRVLPPERDVIQSGPVAFSNWLEHMNCRPYRTEVQLYKSLLFLKRSIDRDLIVTSQREALQTPAVSFPTWNTAFIKPMAWRSRTNARSMGNVPTVWFPGRMNPACLMHDWIYLPSA